jgi:hypothetical protein
MSVGGAKGEEWKCLGQLQILQTSWSVRSQWNLHYT